MNHNYHVYDITLVTLGPVHIGSGETSTTKEYIELEDAYLFPDILKLHKEVGKGGDKLVSELEDFIMSNPNQRNRLSYFINKHHISTDNLGGTRVKKTGKENFSKKGQSKSDINEVSRHIKNSEGNPYIPGSSLKGALRTILTNEIFKVDNSRKDRKAISWGASRNKYFDGKQDVFHHIRVSDSQPLSKDSLMITQKIDISPKKEPNGINLYRESLKPLTRIDAQITCVGQEANDLIKNIVSHGKAHYIHYKNFFLKEFPKEYVTYPKARQVLYLGAGSGFWTKTIIDQGNPSRHQKRSKTSMKGNGTLKLTSAPLKRVKDKNKGAVPLINNNLNLYEMGKVQFNVKRREV